MTISAEVVNVGVMPHLRGITPRGVLQHLKILYGPSFTSDALWGVIAIGHHLSVVIIKIEVKTPDPS